MVCLHLCGVIFLKPLILICKVADEVDCNLALYFDCGLAALRIIEPCLGEPPYPKPVRIYAYHSGDIKTLYVNIPVGERINQSLTQYG